MKLTTRLYGEIEVAEEKIIAFPNGIIGFPDMNQFTLIYDEEQGTGAGIRWLQSLDEPNFAMPVMDPLVVKADYNPNIEDELLSCIGEGTGDNLLVRVTVNVPADLTKMSVNLQGPFVINVDERKACQIIVDVDTYPVKYPIYDILQARKAGV